MDKDLTKVKFLKEIEVVLQDDERDEDDRLISFTVCECMKCHWTFIGDCERHGHGGYTSEGVQVPNYCPMCGSKFGDEMEG